MMADDLANDIAVGVVASLFLQTGCCDRIGIRKRFLSGTLPDTRRPGGDDGFQSVGQRGIVVHDLIARGRETNPVARTGNDRAIAGGPLECGGLPPLFKTAEGRSSDINS